MVVYLSVTPHQQLELFHFTNPPFLPCENSRGERVGIECVVLPLDKASQLENFEWDNESDWFLRSLNLQNISKKKIGLTIYADSMKKFISVWRAMKLFFHPIILQKDRILTEM